METVITHGKSTILPIIFHYQRIFSDAVPNYAASLLCSLTVALSSRSNNNSAILIVPTVSGSSIIISQYFDFCPSFQLWACLSGI